MHILWDGWGDGTPMNLQKLVTLLLIITTFKKSLIFLLPNIKQIIINFFFLFKLPIIHLDGQHCTNNIVCRFSIN